MARILLPSVADKVLSAQLRLLRACSGPEDTQQMGLGPKLSRSMTLLPQSTLPLIDPAAGRRKGPSPIAGEREGCAHLKDIYMPRSAASKLVRWCVCSIYQSMCMCVYIYIYIVHKAADTPERPREASAYSSRTLARLRCPLDIRRPTQLLTERRQVFEENGLRQPRFPARTPCSASGLLASNILNECVLSLSGHEAVILIVFCS